MSADLFDFVPGDPNCPLLIDLPHSGTEVPDEIAGRFASEEVAALPDTDFHLERLYRPLAEQLGAGLLVARQSRYVVDLNRPRDGRPLYPGRAETQVVPRETFAGRPIYRPGAEPDAAEVERRLERWYDPYHARLAEALEERRRRLGYVLLFDGHSIESFVPRLHPEPLPDLMPGTNEGRSLAWPLRAAVLAALEGSLYHVSADRPFRGGWITRAYGRPGRGVHALQLEMARRVYMEDGPPFAWNAAAAALLGGTLEDLFTAFLEAGRRLAGAS